MYEELRARVLHSLRHLDVAVERKANASIIHYAMQLNVQVAELVKETCEQASWALIASEQKEAFRKSRGGS